jgi:Tfp pilus assembly protein PilW
MWGYATGDRIAVAIVTIAISIAAMFVLVSRMRSHRMTDSNSNAEIDRFAADVLSETRTRVEARNG